MASVEYDLDVSGGLMPQVQALIAPPVSDEAAAAKSKKSEKGAEHPYFKRPGKGHNHDSCDACAEGGDLICCDKCPASFHLTCHDPPLDEKDIPTGQWLCHQCRKTKEATTGEKSPQARTKRSNSSTGSNSSGSGPTKVKRSKPNPMEVLVQAASMLNPKQFELPRQMNTPCVFPGTDKVENPCAGRAKGRAIKAVRKPHELAPGGLVPLPARTCYECRRSCRVGPLLSCDYCPLLFHLDCLDPPLTALPAGRWMCPNHVEQYIDSKLVTSVSATERIKLWDRFSAGPVDQDAIKTEFFRKVHCKNPPFRFKIKLSTRKKVSVPAMVQHHYKHPVPLLPSLKDVLRLETVLNRGHQDYLDYMHLTPCTSQMDYASVDLKQITTDTGGGGGGEKYNGQGSDTLCNGQTAAGGGAGVDEPTEQVEHGPPVVNGVKTEPGFVNGTCNGSSPRKDTKLLPDVVSGIDSDIERELKQLDDRLVKLLAYQRIQHLLASHDGSQQTIGQLITTSIQNYRVRHMPLPSELLTPADIDRISRVFTSPKKTRPRSRCALRARAILCPVVSKHFYNVRTTEVDPASVRHDASFMGFRPTVSARFPEAAAMRYRSLTIGKGSANDVELERFGHCNFTSPKHAVIFYDECTKHYELINYSEFGSQVNNVLYSCDFSEKSPATTTAAKRTEDAATLLTSVREIVDKKRRVHRANTPPSLGAGGGGGRMTAVDSAYDSLECTCGPGPVADLSGGWEGTAVLNHGSLLRFGCVTFVFSIVECATV